MAVVKTFVRGRSFIKTALVAFWEGQNQTPTPKVHKLSQQTTHQPASQQKPPPQQSDLQPTATSEPKEHLSNGHATTETPNGLAEKRSVDDFLREAEELLLSLINTPDGLRVFASQLKAQFRERLLTDSACMLPSYNHQLATGRECGRYMALDVGGSTLRVALVDLNGGDSSIVRMDSYVIDEEVKKLPGMAFFEWMAERILTTVSKDPQLSQDHGPENPIPMSLAWSFPIQQTCLKGGLLQGMGKGFLAADTLLGQDLGDIIKQACKTKGLDVELEAIVNDSAAALLSESYVQPSTRFSLILGTGVNIAVHLPVPTIGRPKFGDHRPAEWFRRASHVIVNTELGMFGQGILPITRWDAALNAAHVKPDFQPLEHLVSGYYLGEICRLALVEAIHSTGVFGGVVPPSLMEPYSLKAETLSAIEADTSSPHFTTSLELFKARHPSPVDPTPDDMAVLLMLACAVSQRSSAIIAASLFALWELKTEAETEYLRSLSAFSSQLRQGQEAGKVEEEEEKLAKFAAAAEAELAVMSEKVVVAFNGSVIENYPGYRASVQGFLDQLIKSAVSPSASSLLSSASVEDEAEEIKTTAMMMETPKKPSIELFEAKQSSIRGAAVALACLREGKAN